MNSLIISEFERLIEYIKHEIDDPKKYKLITKNTFRLRQITNSLKALKKVNKEITSSSELNGIPGVGPGTKRRVDEILKEGYLKEIKTVKNSKYNKSINELEEVFGIGRAKALELI